MPGIATSRSAETAKELVTCSKEGRKLVKPILTVRGLGEPLGRPESVVMIILCISSRQADKITALVSLGLRPKQRVSDVRWLVSHYLIFKDQSLNHFSFAIASNA